MSDFFLNICCSYFRTSEAEVIPPSYITPVDPIEVELDPYGEGSEDHHLYHSLGPGPGPIGPPPSYSAAIRALRNQSRTRSTGLYTS